MVHDFIKGSKIAKRLPSVNLQYSKIEKPNKVHRVARRGPLTRAPGALKGEGTLLKLSTFLSQLKGGPFGEKTNFRKVSQCRKTEGGTLWREKNYRKKVSQCRKK